MTQAIISNKNLTLKNSMSYLLASLFVAANLILPQVFHYFSLPSTAYLPIIFFSMVAMLTYGCSVALITAILSPIVSYLLFGMPSTLMSLVVITKGVAFVLALSYFAKKSSKLSITSILLSIVAYQIVGLAVATIFFNFDAALSSLLVSYPAVIMQLLGGYIIIKGISKFRN